MSTIMHLRGDATVPAGNGRKVLVHCCNDQGKWGKGFVTAISSRWPEPERRYRDWHARGSDQGRPFELGQVQFVQVEHYLTVANLIGQIGVRNRREGTAPELRYDALQRGFIHVAQWASMQRATVHMPRIGSGLAEGDWAKVEDLVARCLVAANIPVTVYTL